MNVRALKKILELVDDEGEVAVMCETPDGMFVSGLCESGMRDVLPKSTLNVDHDGVILLAVTTKGKGK